MSIGEHSNVAQTGLDVSANVFIGRYTSIAPYFQAHSMTQHACIPHPELVSTYQIGGYPPTLSEDKIIIGSDVWIGRNATLLGNITIGHGAIIGAFAVVAKDIPPFAVVVGNPAKIIRYRFTEEQIEKLLKIAWWDWDDKKVGEHEPLLKDIDSFLNVVIQ